VWHCSPTAKPSITNSISSTQTITQIHKEVALLAGQQTCDLQVEGSNSGWPPLRSGLGQNNYTCVPMSSSSIMWNRPRVVISLAGKVTAGLVKSDGSLPLGL